MRSRSRCSTLARPPASSPDSDGLRNAQAGDEAECGLGVVAPEHGRVHLDELDVHEVGQGRAHDVRVGQRPRLGGRVTVDAERLRRRHRTIRCPPARCQTSTASCPPGRRARARLANAAGGSAKNITPNRLMSTSKPAAGNGCAWASATTNSAWVSPSSAASRRACWTRGADTSTPSTRPEVATRAARRVETPVPQPMSSTRSWAATAAAAWRTSSCSGASRSKTSAKAMRCSTRAWLSIAGGCWRRPGARWPGAGTHTDWVSLQCRRRR